MSVQVQANLWILRILEKLEPPVEQSAAAGDVALALTSAPLYPTNERKTTEVPTGQNPETSIVQTSEHPIAKEISIGQTSITQTTEKTTNPQKISSTPDVSQNTLKLGYVDVQALPDTQEPPSVIGTINGKAARILLDSGCSTYVLSEEFAVHADIRQYPTTPVPVELAVRNASQPTLKTQTKRLSMSIGQLETRKAFYIAPLPSYDAILGAPFVQEFDVRFPQNPVAVINGMEVPLIQAAMKPQKTQMIS